jgi:ATP-dependent Lon protease
LANAEKIVHSDENDSETEALMRTVFTQFDQYVKLNKKIPPEILTSLATINDAGRLADTISAHLTLKLEEKQKILEMLSVTERLEHSTGGEAYSWPCKTSNGKKSARILSQ